MRLTVAIAVALLVTLPRAGAQEAPAPEASAEWESVEDQGGIEVLRREVQDSPIVAFKGVTVMEAPLDKLLWVLVDNEHKTEWVDMCSESRVVERVNVHEFVIYQRFALPWYLTDRDYVYRGRAVREADGAVRLLLASVDHPEAPETVGIRGQLVASCYVLTALGPNRTRVEVEIQTDPCGMVPDWLVNIVQKEWPRKTLRGISEQVRQDYCGRYPLPAAPGAPATASAPPAGPAKSSTAPGATPAGAPASGR
jgi:hypothetical protein